MYLNMIEQVLKVILYSFIFKYGVIIDPPPILFIIHTVIYV